MVSMLMNSLKGVLWSPSNVASSCGGSRVSIIRRYLEQQHTPE